MVDNERLQNLFVSASLSGDLSIVMRLRYHAIALPRQPRARAQMSTLWAARCQVPIDCKNRKWGFSALMASAGNGHIKVVSYLVTCGANVNLQDKVGCAGTSLLCCPSLPPRRSRHTVTSSVDMHCCA
jgi:hypothetical protein